MLKLKVSPGRGSYLLWKDFLCLLLDIDCVICYIFTVLCRICQNEFIPNKYHPRQQVCSNLECQRIRQIQNEKEWRMRNPDYFKCSGQSSSWRESRHRYTKLWRAHHKDYLRKYEENHKQQRQEYMREYMRRYREAKSVNR